MKCDKGESPRLELLLSSFASCGDQHACFRQRLGQISRLEHAWKFSRLFAFNFFVNSLCDPAFRDCLLTLYTRNGSLIAVATTPPAGPLNADTRTKCQLISSAHHDSSDSHDVRAYPQQGEFQAEASFESHAEIGEDKEARLLPVQVSHDVTARD